MGNSETIRHPGEEFVRFNCIKQAVGTAQEALNIKEVNQEEITESVIWLWENVQNLSEPPSQPILGRLAIDSPELLTLSRNLKRLGLVSGEVVTSGQACIEFSFKDHSPVISLTVKEPEERSGSFFKEVKLIDHAAIYQQSPVVKTVSAVNFKRYFRL